MQSYAELLERQQAQKDEYDRQRKLMEYQFQLEQQRIQQARDAELRQREAAETQRKKAEEEAARNAVSTGTGFFVASGGYLVTNNHVIKDKTDYAVRDLKGRFYKATAVARDTTRDLALLKVSGSFAPLRVASSETVSKGQRVLAVGYPQISIQGNESKVTDGIISSFSGINNDDHWFQISVPIQGGNSGGPLVTENGAVVGVVVATANVAKFFKMTGNLPQNVNYAIKSKVLIDFLKSQNISSAPSPKGKTTIDAVDASTVLVIAKNGPIDVSYTVSPEQLARDERDRKAAAAQEAAQRKAAQAEERKQAAIAAADEAKRAKDEKREAMALKERTRLIEKRDLEIQKTAVAASRPLVQVATNMPQETPARTVPQPTLSGIGNIIEVNTQYGFAVVSTGQTIPKDSRLIVESSGSRIPGKAERNSDGKLSITLDNAPVTQALVGSRVFLVVTQ